MLGKKKGRKGLTYTLFKTQSTPLSASSRKCSWTLTYNLFKPRAAHSQYHVIQNLISTYNMWKVFQYIIDCCHPFCIFWPLPLRMKHNSNSTDQHYVSSHDIETNNLFTAYSINRDKWFCWTERKSFKMASSERTAAVSFTSTLQSLVVFCISTIYHQFTASMKNQILHHENICVS